MPFKPKIGVSTISISQLDLFHPERLTASSFEAAVAAFGKVISSPGSCDVVLPQLLSQPLWVEVALSAVPDHVFSVFQTCLIGHFPGNAAAFDSSLAARLIQRLSMSLFVLPCGRSSDTLLQHNREVSSLMPALLALPKFGFGTPASPSSPEDEFGIFVVRKKSQKAHRRERSMSVQMMAPDPAIFERSGLYYPDTKDDVEDLEEHTLGRMHTILGEYLDILRQSEFAEAIQEAYLAVHVRPEHLNHHVRTTSETKAADPASLVEVAAEDNSLAAFLAFQPMHNSLYFDTAEGFGQWRILMSGRVVRDLQVACKRQPKRFAIYMKKIKELSNGMFSPDNQKRLTGPGTEVPVFEAKMTADSRLVTVDCVPQINSEIEQQVICVYGIYTHAQLDNRFWDSMSYQLGRKGKEYRRRCIFRSQPVHKGDYVFLPATFGEPLAQIPLEPVAVPSAIRPEDCEEIHTLTVLEKFMTLSQPLLNSILANQDVQHVFNVSPHEKKIVDHNSSCYVLGRSGTGKTTTMLFKMLRLERSWEENQAMHGRIRQVFVTQSRVLASKVEEYFSKLLESLAAANGTVEEAERVVKAMERLVDEDEEENWHGTLPSAFSQLEDHHFPLFVTFDRLCKLLEADVGVWEPTHVRSPTAESISSPILSRAQGGGMISYSDFLGSYWGHFPQSLTKNLDPALVYSEFLGVIEGSELTRERDECYLDRDTYLKLSPRSNSTFASQRDLVWRLFEVYLKRKRSLGHRDAADRTHNILQRWEASTLSRPKIDFLYVDEAQDNLLIDALLLRSICRNPDGLFWAGDTAQTIANGGSAFRFDDLKAYLYRIEMNLKKRKDYPIKSTPPHAFQLAVNYRSHAGIVNCASSVVRVVTHLWPYSIDVMQEESGIVDGPKPVVFSGWDEKAVRYEQFLFGEGGSHMEFGAHQCILVRNDAARNKLRSEVGDIGLIMTLYESKGLEFNDVLLFNFFEDSSVELAQWRVILNLLPSESRGNVPCPRFDEMRHAGVCAELKFLYVAITRARKNIWIVDSSGKGEPVRAFWTANGLIENCTPGSKVPRLAVSSTAEEWAKSGRTLFRSKRYYQAMHCFERAEMPRETAIAHAYLLRDTARNLLGGSKTQASERAQAFADAADAFVQCAKREQSEERATYFRVAGECFAQANEHLKAGQAFYEASEYTLSARQYRKGDHFDEAVEVVQNHDVDPAFAATLVDVAKFYYITSGAPEKAAPLFDSIDDQLEYMDDADLDVARAHLLEATGRISEAADVHMAEGRPMQALEILLNDKETETSLRCGKDQLLEYLWQHMSFGVVFGSNSTNLIAQELLQLVGRIDPARLSQEDIHLFDMFKAIAAKDSFGLRRMAEHFMSANNNPAALHCLDHIFRTPPAMQVASDQDMLEYLRQFYSYTVLLRSASTETGVRDGMRRLFGLTANSQDGTYFASAGTYLHTQVVKSSLLCLQSTDDGTLLSTDQTSEYITRALTEMLKTRVNQHYLASHELRAFQSCCIQHTVFSGCHRSYCNRQHVDVKSVNAVWYSRRVGVHLLQILVLQTSQSLLRSQERAGQQRLWLSKLYEAIFPPYFSLGSPCLWDKELLPETSKAIDVAQDWLRELVYTINPFLKPQSTRFLTFFMQANALSKILGQEAFREYISRARCMVDLRPFNYFRSAEGHYILNDCVEMTLGQQPASVAQGLLFACHVLDKCLPVDISVFCDYLDQMCTVISVDNRLKRYYRLNNIMLPRNWLLQLVRHPQSTPNQKDFHGLLKKLLSQLPSMLDLLAREDDVMQEWVFFAGTPLYKLGFLIRQIFIARICKTLTLLAYNTNYYVRDDVFRCLKSLQKPGRRLHPIYAEYAEAREPFVLTSIARRSASGVSLDEMVQVFHKPLLPVGHRELPGVRRIVYSHFNDLGSLLENRSTLRAEAAAFKPRDLIAQEPDMDADDEITEDHFDAEGASAGQALIDVTEVHVVSKKEHTAATHIQQVYRRYLRRTRSSIETPLASSRRAIFDQLAKAAQDIPSSRYRKYYLGPLAHALLCADKTQQWVFQLKKKTKRQLSNMKTGDMEEIRARQTKTTSLLKRARDIQKSLEAGSKLHQEADVKKLGEQVVLLQNLVQELPAGSLQEVEEDLLMAFKAIVQERVVPQPSKSLKPTLALDDPYDLLDDV